jgi:hypothetical protein
MNDRRDERDELLDEALLRRALRFEPDERAPRFDAAAIAALASDGRPSRGTLAAGLLAAVVTGLSAGAIWSTLFDNAPAIAATLGGAALDLVIAAAAFLVPIAEVASQPAVPLSLLAALGVAIVHELRERKERAHAHAS